MSPARRPWQVGQYVRVQATNPPHNTVGMVATDDGSTQDPDYYLKHEDRWTVDFIVSTRPAKAEDFQTAAASHTYPFLETEDIVFVGFGHQDRAAFADELRHFDIHFAGLSADESGVDVDYIEHLWAVQIVLDGDDSGYFRWRDIDRHVPGAFPVTVVYR